jgi:hypothetical protein
MEKCIEKISKTKLISTKPTMTEPEMLDLPVMLHFILFYKINIQKILFISFALITQI